MSFYDDVLKHVTDTLDFKAKDFAVWGLKLKGKAGDATFSHEHKMEGADVAKTKIEMDSVPFPGLESFKGTHEQDKKKFVKSLGTDIYKENGNKVNWTMKWTWTPAKNTHVINSTKKVETEDMGGFKAFIKNEIDVTHKSGEDQKFEVKGSLVMAGDEWKVGAAGEMLNAGNKASALATYNLCSNANVWANFQHAFPDEDWTHNKVMVGGAGTHNGIEHLAQLTVNLPMENKGETKNYEGFLGQPIDVQMGVNWKASEATTVAANVKVNENLEYHSDVSHVINSNLTAKLHQHFFYSRLNVKEGETAKPPVDVGFEFSYKL